MLPILISVQSREKFDQYIDEYVAQHSLHPSSVYRVHPEKTILSIDQIRDVSQIAQQAHGPTLIAMYDFHTAKEDSQNALLKTLEENNAHVSFLLAVHDDSDVLPTIRSRTHLIRLEDNQLVTHELLATYALLDPTMSLEKWMGKTSGVTRDDAVRLLIELMMYLQSQLRLQPESYPYTAALVELLGIYRVLIRNNVNFEYSLDAAGRVLNTYGLIPLPQ